MSNDTTDNTISSLSKHIKMLWVKVSVLIFLAVFGLGADHVWAQKAKVNEIIARANGMPVTTADVEIFKKEQSAYVARIPEELRYRTIVNILLQEALMAKEALDLKLHETQNYQFRISYYQKKALREAYQQEKVISGVTDKRVKDFYDSLVANAKPTDEVRVRHIVVRTLEDAQNIREELVKGADFAKLANARSVGASGKVGGDIGYITENQHGKIGKTAFAMKKGEISQPLQTKRGWHILKLEDRRKRKLQAFRDIQVRLKDAILRNEMNDAVKKLKKNAKIEYIDPAAAPKEAKAPAATPDKKSN